MLTILKVLPIISLILAIILIVICVVIQVLISKELVRWREYKQSNIIVESFEMFDKGLLSRDKSADIDRIKHEYNEQYEAYKDHNCLNGERNRMMITSGIFSFVCLLLSGIFYMIKCMVM
jgi:hypothetical protein